jgi:transcriptional regulator with XRE-family HTH domain
MAPVKKPPMSLGKTFLKEWRSYRGVSQQAAADFISVSRGLLSKIENAQSPYLQQHVEGLARLYESTPAELIGRDPTQPARPSSPITSDAEILAFLARIEGLREPDINVAFAVINNAMTVNRAGSAPFGSRDQSRLANPRHEPEPSQ